MLVKTEKTGENNSKSFKITLNPSKKESCTEINPHIPLSSENILS